MVIKWRAPPPPGSDTFTWVTIRKKKSNIFKNPATLAGELKSTHIMGYVHDNTPHSMAASWCDKYLTLYHICSTLHYSGYYSGHYLQFYIDLQIPSYGQPLRRRENCCSLGSAVCHSQVGSWVWSIATADIDSSNSNQLPACSILCAGWDWCCPGQHQHQQSQLTFALVNYVIMY